MDRRKAAGCLMLTGAVLAFGMTELFTPSYAHVEQSSLWAGRIPEETDQTADSRDLLRDGGQTVLLGALEEERKLPVLIPVGGTVTVEVSDQSRIAAEIRTEEKENGATENYLWIYRIAADTVPGGDSEDGSGSASGDSGENGAGSSTEEKKDASGEDTGEASAGENGTGQLQAEVKELLTPKLNSQAVIPVTEETEGTTEGTDPEQPDSTETPGNTEEPEQPDMPNVPDSTEALLSVTVVWTAEGEEGQTKSAVFQMEERPEEGAGSISLADQVTSYNQRTPIEITAGEEDTVLLCNGSGFPSMTRYRVGETEYLLYDKMPLTLAAGEQISLDLSGTGISGKLTLSAGKDSKKSLKYQELSTLDAPERPVLVGKKATEVPVVWTEEEKMTTFTVERLEYAESGLAWSKVEDDSVEVVPDLEGNKLTLTSQGAVAGTYRVSLIWQTEGVETAREVIPFYVFYAEGEEDE